MIIVEKRDDHGEKPNLRPIEKKKESQEKTKETADQ